jgi:hypothetical protein
MNAWVVVVGIHPIAYESLFGFEFGHSALMIYYSVHFYRTVPQMIYVRTRKVVKTDNCEVVYGVPVGFLTFVLALCSAMFEFLLKWICTDIFLCAFGCLQENSQGFDGGIAIWGWTIHFRSTSNGAVVWNGLFSVSVILSVILYILSG